MNTRAGAEGGTRTRTPVPAGDFKSPASAVPPLRPKRHYPSGRTVCQDVLAYGGRVVESIIKCRRNRYGFSCIIFLSEGRRKEVKTLNGYSYLTLEQRREIERMYAEGERVVDIAARLKRSAAAIYEELKRGYTGEFDGYARPKYSADLAQATVQENFRRRGNRRGANC